MDHHEIETRLDKHFNAYTLKADSIARAVFQREVLPFLKTRGWKFLSGNGTFWIGPRAGRNVDRLDRPDDKELHAILDILDIDVPGINNCLGELMPDWEE